MEPTTITEGEFTGWQSWENEPFEHDCAGPFYLRKDGENWVAAFRAENKHMNSDGNMHGGCLMTFADFALFAISNDVPGNSGVTVAFTCEFLSGAKQGEYIEARGEVVGGGRSISFIRGIITANDRPVLNFSGTIKKARTAP